MEVVVGDEKSETSNKSLPLTNVFGYFALMRLYNPSEERKS